MNYSSPHSSVLGISQARILERVAMPSSRGSFQPRDQTMSPALAGKLSHQGIPLPSLKSLLFGITPECLLGCKHLWPIAWYARPQNYIWQDIDNWFRIHVVSFSLGLAFLLNAQLGKSWTLYFILDIMFPYHKPPISVNYTKCNFCLLNVLNAIFHIPILLKKNIPRDKLYSGKKATVFFTNRWVWCIGCHYYPLQHNHLSIHWYSLGFIGGLPGIFS